MRHIHAFILVLAVCGLVQAAPTPKQVDQVILLDVLGMWGGQDLWISGNRKAVCRIVAPLGAGEKRLKEIRYEFELAEDQYDSLLKLIQKHNFFSIPTNNRKGTPIETRPRIFVKAGDMSHATAKWSNDKQKDFDPIYKLLIKMVESGKAGAPHYRGAYDLNWRPEGFIESKTIWERTKPKINNK